MEYNGIWSNITNNIIYCRKCRKSIETYQPNYCVVCGEKFCIKCLKRCNICKNYYCKKCNKMYNIKKGVCATCRIRNDNKCIIL